LIPSRPTCGITQITHPAFSILAFESDNRVAAGVDVKIICANGLADVIGIEMSLGQNPDDIVYPVPWLAHQIVELSDGVYYGYCLAPFHYSIAAGPPPGHSKKTGSGF
jgi:hypothetical protein